MVEVGVDDRGVGGIVGERERIDWLGVVVEGGWILSAVGGVWIVDRVVGLVDGDEVVGYDGGDVGGAGYGSVHGMGDPCIDVGLESGELL